MPVRELTERTRVPRMGKIRLGEKAKNANGVEYPVAREYFVVPDELKPLLGEKPTEIKIIFLTDDEEAILNQYYRLYNSSHGLACKGDGYKADALLDADELAKRGGDVTTLDRDMWAHGSTRGRKRTENVVRRQIECLGAGYEGKPACPMYGTEGCGVKLFMQAAVYGAPGLGVYEMDTGSLISIQNITGVIHFVKSLTHGRVAGIPFLLKRVKTEVAPPPDMRKKTIWTVTLEVDPAMNPGQLLTQAAKEPIYALMPPIDDTETDVPFNDEEAIEGIVVNDKAAGALTPEGAAGASTPADATAHEEGQETVSGRAGAAVTATPSPPSSPAIGDWWARTRIEKFDRDDVLAASIAMFDGREPADVSPEQRDELLESLRQRKQAPLV